MIGKASLCLSQTDILNILNKECFTGIEKSAVWIIYPTTVYDLVESPEEFRSFAKYFFSNTEQKYSSLYSLYSNALCGLFFRPLIMEQEDFVILREAVTYFSSDEKLCLGCGSSNMP